MCSLLNNNKKKIIIYPFPESGNHPTNNESPKNRSVMKEIVKIKSISLHKLNNAEERRRVKAASEGE